MFEVYKDVFPFMGSENWEKLKELRNLLLDWNSKVNLISRKDVEEIIPNHILPSLSMTVVRRFQNAERVIDVGTGGGLPGLPMAIANPQANFILLDSNRKKMTIVEDIAKSLELTNVRVVCSRAELYEEKFDFILGRAVSALPNFLSFSSHLLDRNSAAVKTSTKNGIEIGSGLLYLKGGDFSNEISDARINAQSTHLFAVKDLIPSPSEKFVLYVQGKEISAFYDRHVRSLRRK